MGQVWIQEMAARPAERVSRLTLAGLALISAASLALEILLTRVVSIAQWYHAAFMLISVALLGFAASGSFLAATGWSQRRSGPPAWVLPLCGPGVALGTLTALLGLGRVPFDSFRLSVEPMQLLYLATQYVAAAVPFFFAGLAAAMLLAAAPRRAGTIYAANLVGAGAGCLLALALLPYLGSVGTSLALMLIALIAGGCFAASGRGGRGIRVLLPAILTVGVAAVLIGAPTAPGPAGGGWLQALAPQMSPYKALPLTLHYPDARLALTRWSAAARVDVIESTAIRSAPGLSFGYDRPLPRQWGLTQDGDNLTPVTAVTGSVQSDDSLAFVEHLPGALTYRLAAGGHPHRALILQAHTGLDVLAALRHGISAVHAVVPNPLVLAVLRDHYGAFTGNLFGADQTQVQTHTGNGRSAARRLGTFDAVVLSLADTFRPVDAGSYSLTESYAYTVEAFIDYWRALRPDGVLAVQRWVQTPPAESVRVAATAAEALRRLGVREPGRHVAAIRSWSTVLVLVKRTPLTAADLARAEAFAAERRFDLVWFGGLPIATNRYNVLPRPYDSEAFAALLSGPDPRRFLATYPFDVRPTTDDRPFFFHTFRWQRAREVLARASHTWQPFGGGGLLVIAGLLGIALLASVAFVVLPVALAARTLGRQRGGRSGRPRGGIRQTTRWLLYFASIGLAFLFVEIPLIEQGILVLERPTYALAGVLAVILLASGIGSMVADRLPAWWTPRLGLAVLVALTAAFSLLMSTGAGALLSGPLALRVGALVVALAPLGVLMGQPLPRGISGLGLAQQGLIPWAWAVNGATSVVASILAILLALSFGFRVVLWGGAVAYALALLVLPPPSSEHRVVPYGSPIKAGTLDLS